MATWYWQNITTDGSWSTVGNWTDDYDGIGNNPIDPPWTTSATKDDDIEDGALSNFSYPIQDGNIETEGITGVCNVIVDNYGLISSGTWSNSVSNSGFIGGGLFTGYGLQNVSGGEIYGGTFTGDYAYNYSFSLITGGIFSGSNMTNEGMIYNGFFDGAEFSHSDGEILGGGFKNPTITTSGPIYGGMFEVGTYNNSSFIGGAILTADSFLENAFNNSGAFWLLSGSIKYNGRTYTATGVANPNANYNGFKSITTSDILGSGLI